MLLQRPYSTMSKTSIYCLLVLFIFENLIVHGLVNEETIKQKPKPIAVEILHEKLLPKESEPIAVLLNNDTDVIDTAKSAKVSIKNNVATHNTKGNKTSDLKFKMQNTTTNATNNATTSTTTTTTTITTTTTTTVAYSDNIVKDKTDEVNIHDTEKGGSSSKSNVVTATNGTTITKPMPETNTANENRTEITLNTEETTMVSDLTTNDSSEKTSVIFVSSSEISSTKDSTTSLKPITTKGIISTEEPQESEVSVEQKQNEKMSSGIIALVMAIVFAIVVIFIYVGLLVWRRYLEYRYGNRELLVNDLEFDTNDLRHFEL